MAAPAIASKEETLRITGKELPKNARAPYLIHVEDDLGKMTLRTWNEALAAACAPGNTRTLRYHSAPAKNGSTDFFLDAVKLVSAEPATSPKKPALAPPDSSHKAPVEREELTRFPCEGEPDEVYTICDSAAKDAQNIVRKHNLHSEAFNTIFGTIAIERFRRAR